MVPGSNRLECGADVTKQMPPIDDLPRFGRARPNAFGKDLGAITRDRLDATMGSQPIRRRSGIAVRQEW
ncbi:hypothetical protein GCM10011390_21940 [Aureimonas endophytica]|uniref:Uncharacterized protein n=1 Tax=Aureimonas endophytica TaxID=2027858 RepID=A0A916ZLV8_9HYPH|nr:hypothetical protein GCM10011390_21940 [Aureimonas endophytica]